MTKFYSVKHLFTYGIEEWEGEIDSVDKRFALRGTVYNLKVFRCEKLGRDSFLTEKEAYAAAIKLIHRKRTKLADRLIALDNLENKLQEYLDLNKTVVIEEDGKC